MLPSGVLSSSRLVLYSPWARIGSSPWPILIAYSAAGGLVSLIMYFWGASIFPFLFHGTLISICAWGWGTEIIEEGTFCGMYTSVVTRGLKWSVWLFIFSEVMFFFSFFWAFAHCSVVPSFELGCRWPPAGIKPIHPMALPVFNLCVLITSSMFLNLSSGYLRLGHHTGCQVMLIATIFLSSLFFYAQFLEYKAAWFTITDGVFGSTFFLLTGFHGFHVFVGSVVLILNLIRHGSQHFHTGFNIGWMGGVWYWHFVDLVWIVIWLFVYTWGSWGGSSGFYTYGM